MNIRPFDVHTMLMTFIVGYEHHEHGMNIVIVDVHTLRYCFLTEILATMNVMNIVCIFFREKKKEVI